MRAEHQLRNFERALAVYREDVPLFRFLKEFFRQNRQMGSSDRKSTGRLMYAYYRIGLASANLAPQQRLALALFLCHPADELLATLRPDLHGLAELPLAERISRLVSDPDFGFRLNDVFPFWNHFSEGIDTDTFLSSHFTQPDLFIRPHPGKATGVTAKLESSGLLFSTHENGAFRLPNATRLEEVFGQEPPFEVQDLSSQETGEWFKPQRWEKWWDACAASGGKSLLLLAQQPDLGLVVSDIRESILENLDERFRKAGIHKYQKKLLDLTGNPEPVLHDYAFDGIILDAPCTGSGTWGRSPEMITQFKESTIAKFSHLQRTIAANVIKYLKPGKPLIYITCSVFREENEEMVNYLVNEFGLSLEGAQLIDGYRRKADTMFVARLVRGVE